MSKNESVDSVNNAILEINGDQCFCFTVCSQSVERYMFCNHNHERKNSMPRNYKSSKNTTNVLLQENCKVVYAVSA